MCETCDDLEAQVCADSLDGELSTSLLASLALLAVQGPGSLMVQGPGWSATELESSNGPEGLDMIKRFVGESYSLTSRASLAFSSFEVETFLVGV